MKATIALAAVTMGFDSVTLSARPLHLPQAETPAIRQLAIVPTLADHRAPKSAKAAAQSAYLLAYFKDETHSLYFATSRDGYSFTDVNGGEPVLSGRTVPDQKGIRDPHIMRGLDNAFYMSMTDLHIFAQREGLRATEWEWPDKEYGWGNNRNMLFMKSHDMLHWTLSKVVSPSCFPRTGTSAMPGRWRPSTIPRRSA